MISDLKDKSHSALGALLPVYPDFQTRAYPFHYKVTRITIETIGGKSMATVTGDLEAIISYLPIPSSLSHGIVVVDNNGHQNVFGDACQNISLGDDDDATAFD